MSLITRPYCAEHGWFPKHRAVPPSSPKPAANWPQRPAHQISQCLEKVHYYGAPQERCTYQSNMCATSHRAEKARLDSDCLGVWTTMCSQIHNRTVAVPGIFELRHGVRRCLLPNIKQGFLFAAGRVSRSLRRPTRNDWSDLANALSHHNLSSSISVVVFHVCLASVRAHCVSDLVYCALDVCCRTYIASATYSSAGSSNHWGRYAWAALLGVESVILIAFVPSSSVPWSIRSGLTRSLEQWKHSLEVLVARTALDAQKRGCGPTSQQPQPQPPPSLPFPAFLLDRF